jgi:hypothetical protein
LLPDTSSIIVVSFRRDRFAKALQREERQAQAPQSIQQTVEGGLINDHAFEAGLSAPRLKDCLWRGDEECIGGRISVIHSGIEFRREETPEEVTGTRTARG